MAAVDAIVMVDIAEVEKEVGPMAIDRILRALGESS